MGFLDTVSKILSIRWAGGSVSGLVVIAGIICFILSTVNNNPLWIPLGAFFVVLGLLGAIVMTYIIRSK